ncbi:hypothetical protein KAJ89_03580 [Candidatus Parcubacteria bacterium]|nr:hypothetical protein [Candidatus Parcubacteria bacterium]
MIISADIIKKQMKDYDPGNAEEYHRESARTADIEFKNALKVVKKKKVILMNGGSASGKTEFVSEYLNGYEGIIFDGTLPTPEGARVKIKKIARAHKEAVVYSVIPDDLLRAFVAFLNRDRKFQDIHFYKTHSGSRKTLLWIAEKYPDLKLKIFESSYNKIQNMIFSELIFDNKEQELFYLQGIQMTVEKIIKLVNEKI